MKGKDSKSKDSKDSKDKSREDSKNSRDSNKCYGKGASGLNEHCYRTGYDHTKTNTSPDAIGEAIDAFPCTTNNNANRCYGKGIVDGHADKYRNTSNKDNQR